MGEGPGSGNPAGRNDQYPLCTFYRSTPHLRRGSMLIMTGVFLGVGLRRRQEGENFFSLGNTRQGMVGGNWDLTFESRAPSEAPAK